MMKNEILNIYANTKILFYNLAKRNHYLSNYKINYFELNYNNEFHFYYDQFNVFFIPPDYKASECNYIIKYIKKINTSQLILCIDKSLAKIFSNWDDNLLFLPISFDDLQKKVNFLKLSSKICFKNLQLNRLNNTLSNIEKKSKINLTQIEVNIIGILMKAKKNVSRSTLNSKALGYAKQVNSHSLDSHMYRLRKKLILISKTNEILAKPPGYYQLT